MKFIEPQVTPVVEDAPIKVIERAYRICYKSEGRMGEGSEKLISKLLYSTSGGNIHSSPLEHRSVVATVPDWVASDITWWQMMRGTGFILVAQEPVSFDVDDDGYLCYNCTGNLRAFWDYVVSVTEDESEQDSRSFVASLLASVYPEIFGKLPNANAENITEHAMVMDDPEFVTFHVVTTRDILQEIARNRTISPNVESTRYCNYGNLGVQFCIPYPYEWCDNVDWDTDLKQTVLNAQYKDGKPVTAFEYIENCTEFKDLYLYSMSLAESIYNKALELGVKPQEARMVLPGGLKTEMLLSGSYRNWAHFINLRNDSAAHPQMIHIAAQIEDWFLNKGIEIRNYDNY